MQLIDVLDGRVVDLNAGATNKEEVLALFAGRLKGADYIANVEAFKKDIYLHKNEGTTGIGNHIAIPHGKSDSMTQIDTAVAKLKHEIEWETLDDKGVRLAFLFAVSNDHECTRNRILLLTDITRKSGNDEAVGRLLQVEDIEELRKIFAGK